MAELGNHVYIPIALKRKYCPPNDMFCEYLWQFKTYLALAFVFFFHVISNSERQEWWLPVAL